MRSLEYLIKRFEFALLQKKPLYPSQADVDALNTLARYFNGKTIESPLEDALILFYILQHWKVENEANKYLKMRENKQGVFRLTDADILLQKLSMLLDPKTKVIEMIRDELRIHQAMNNVPQEQRIKTKDVRFLLEQTIRRAKNNFPIMKDLNDLKIKCNDKGNHNRQSTQRGHYPQP